MSDEIMKEMRVLIKAEAEAFKSTNAVIKTDIKAPSPAHQTLNPFQALNEEWVCLGAACAASNCCVAPGPGLMRANSNYVFASKSVPSGAWDDGKWQEDKHVDWIVDSGCTHPTCTAQSSSNLTNARPGEYLGAFQTPDGSRSTPKLAGDQAGTIGTNNTIPLVISDVAVQRMYRVNLLPEDVLTGHGITIVNSPRVGKCLTLPDQSYQRLRKEHGLHYLRVFCKPLSQSLAMTRAQRRAAVIKPAPTGVTNAKPTIKSTPTGVANDITIAMPVPVVQDDIRPKAIERLIRLHFKLCHCNFQKLKHYLECNGLLKEFSSNELQTFRIKIKDMCCFCGMAKCERVPMLVNPDKEVQVLFPGERVSCDVLGKFVSGIGGMLHCWIFYDWATEKTRFYPVHAKSEYLRVFKQHQIDAGLRKGGCVIGPVRLMSDAGSEFLSAAARDHYRECGTRCTASPPGRNEWNGRAEGLWAYYLRTMYTTFAANPTMPLKLWTLLIVHLSNVFAVVPKTRKLGELVTPHEAEAGVKPPMNACRAPFYAPMVCENFRKVGGKFESLPGRLGFYCGQCPVTPVADYAYMKDTDRVIVAYGAKSIITEVNNNDVWVARFAPEAVQSLIEPRPSQAMPREPQSAEMIRAVLCPNDKLEPPADLENLCGELAFLSRYEHVDTDEFELDALSTGLPVGGNQDVNNGTEMNRNMFSETETNTNGDDKALAADADVTLGDALKFDCNLDSTLNLDDFDADVAYMACTHTMTPHRAPIHVDYGTHMAIKGDQYHDLDYEQLCGKCKVSGLKPGEIISTVEPSAVVYSIQRQLQGVNQIGLMHRIRQDYECIALRAALINHDNDVFSNASVCYGGRGDDSPSFVNQVHHLAVPEAVHTIIDDHVQLDIGCDYADGLLRGNVNQPLIKEVQRDRVARQRSADAAINAMPRQATRSATTHKANITTEVGRSLKELKKKNNAHYDDHVRAMKDELEKVKTFEVFEDVLECDITNKAMIVNSILLFAEKYGKNNEFIKAKCRLAAQGFSQQEGLSYFDTYAATPQDATWRYMMSLAASHNC